MSAVAKLQNQKEQLLARLDNDPGPNERAEIQALLAKIETEAAWHLRYRRQRSRRIALRRRGIFLCPTGYDFRRPVWRRPLQLQRLVGRRVRWKSRLPTPMNSRATLACMITVTARQTAEIARCSQPCYRGAG
ncbi:hypothetical protein [Bradyrhizobium japonicum]|uniref:hypothetical protein n=1 Tax=Bradyrhizobium japonicum TaxID=375 RepID=UPI001BA43CB5|nr:hypothetical protein [Bradyrhizobium japonicum]MBR0915424.1 hypothetical protein [Bradyrhizobium japonicum]